MRSRKATQREAAVFARLDRLVAGQVRAIAPPTARTPPAGPGLTPRERSALAAFSDVELERIGRILDRLPAAAIAADLAKRSVPAPDRKIPDSGGLRPPLNARSGRFFQG